MSDENKNENNDWRLDSLEEDDDIIELTEEIEPPAQPVISKQDSQDLLKETVIGLEDTAILETNDEVHDLMEDALEGTELDEISPIEETEEQLFELGDEAVSEPDDDEVHDLMEDALEGTELDEISPIEETEEQLFELGDEAVLEPDDEVKDFMEAAVEDSSFEDVAPIEETAVPFDLDKEANSTSDDKVHELMEAAFEDTAFEAVAPIEESEVDANDLGDEAMLAADDEVHELMEAAIEDVGFEEAEADEHPEDIALDFETEILSGAEDEAHEPQEDAAVVGDLNDRLLHEDAEKFEFEDDTSAQQYEQIEEMSVTAMEEIGLEELQPVDSAEEFGMPDIETEVDIAEIADLEPIQSELPAEEPPRTELDDVIELHEELTADLVEPVPAPDDDIIEISDFDQQYFSKEEAEGATVGLPVVEATEEDDYLELIDVEDGEDDSAELNGEIIHLGHTGTENDAVEMDDILAEPDQGDFDLESSIGGDSEAHSDLQLSSSEVLSNESAAASLISGAGDFLEKEPVPGFFESTVMDEDSETETTHLVDPEDGIQAEALDINGAAMIPAAVSTAQIEAAVANIIERDYAGQIENMVATAIEKVVALEIERIKSTLFGDEED